MEPFKITENLLIDSRLIKVISDNTGLKQEESAELIRYNTITTYQLAKITNRSTSAIQNLMRPLRVGEEPKFKSVLPFKYKDNKGPIFILFDKSVYDYIISSHKPIAKNHEKVQSNNRQP